MVAPNWPAIRAGIFAGESGGDYNALFGFSNRAGGPFANTKLTDMTVDQALAFADPSGPYASYVNGKIGRVATPMGAYQVVGSTLKAAKNGLGLTGNERMTPETQDRIGQWILANQGTSAWAGYRGPRDPASVPPPLPGKVGGDSMVARNFDPQVAAATNTPQGGGILGGMMADAGIPQGVADYAAADDSRKSPLATFLEKLGQVDTPAPMRFGPMGDARDSGGLLLKALSQPTIADYLLRKRMA